jgi:hypothetical protein
MQRLLDEDQVLEKARDGSVAAERLPQLANGSTAL